MERGGCWATDHGVAESDMTQHACMHEPAHTHTHSLCTLERQVGMEMYQPNFKSVTPYLGLYSTLT